MIGRRDPAPRAVRPGSRAEVHHGVAIGAAARAAGLTVKMVRHYEAIGLLRPVRRGRGQVRRFSMSDVHTLRFIAGARSVGFPLRTIRQLLSLWQDPRRSNAQIKALAQRHFSELQERLRELTGMIGSLQQLIAACAGDGRPDCPILDDFAERRRDRKRQRN